MRKAVFFLALPLLIQTSAAAAHVRVLRAEQFQHFIDTFNRNDRELYPGSIPNSAAWEFLKNNIPLLDCPDAELEEIYYFRWWTFRKHLRRTPGGWVVTEFLPDVPWAGKYNTISCAAGHHFREGRWLADPRYLSDYARFWFSGKGRPRSYSFWAADSVWQQYLVSGDDRLIRQLLPALIDNYRAWESTHRDANGLYWQSDDRDGMELSIGGANSPHGEGYRCTINSYQYGDAMAIAKMAQHLQQPRIVEEYFDKARQLKSLVQGKLWDPERQFFLVLPRKPDAVLCTTRELSGFTPWYFDLPDADKSAAWKQLMDPGGFYAPFGPTTAERWDPKFAVSYRGHECQWNGPSWPFATSITLTAMANLLNDSSQNVVTATDYWKLLKIYIASQHRTRDDGVVVPWIDEDLNPFTGDWIARTILKSRGSAIEERGKDYNHSTCCDLIISGLIGLRPRADDIVEVNPLLPPDTWDHFCLDRVRYHSHWLTILYDRDGSHYGRGTGFRLFSDGVQIAAAKGLRKLTASLVTPASPQTAGGWVKSPENPVLGGKYGTCFDVCVLHEADTYRMWVSWRPKKSIAIVQSKDGIHWSEPPTVVFGPRPETGWEDDINRPIVLKTDRGYDLFYTGQARGHSAIGYATSRDGVTWKRMSDRPVLRADQPWEKVAVMNPHVIWDSGSGQYRMWYSAGEQYEPNAIGYATSPDGLHWTKNPKNPIFTPDANIPWEHNRVAGCQVVPHDGQYLLFYIGYRDIDHAQIGVARSSDGITHWQRLRDNPIIRASVNGWDGDACYKPFAIFDGKNWMLWYNGRHRSLEQIGVATHKGDIVFDGN